MREPDLFTEPRATPKPSAEADDATCATRAQEFRRERAHARATDRSTSHEAAASVTNITEKQRAVLACLATFGREGAADVELVERYKRLRWEKQWPPLTDSSIRTRRSELVDKKLNEIGEKRIGRRMHTVWAVL